MKKSPAWLYLIAADATDYMKIGVTETSVDDRVAALQTGSPQVLRVVRAVKCESMREARTRETALHKELNQYRSVGEWFVNKQGAVLAAFDVSASGAVPKPASSSSGNRLLRLKDAPKYLGLDRHTFDKDVRPELTELRHGRAVLFDRLELDAWADYAMSRGRPPLKEAQWQSERCRDSSSEETPGISRSGSRATAGSMRQLVQRITTKRSATSRIASKRSAVQ